MRNIHKQLILTIIPALCCAFVGSASADDLDSLESVADVCRFSEPAANPFLISEEDAGYSAESSSETQSRDAFVSTTEQTSTQSVAPAGHSRRVYSSRSANTHVRAEIDVYRGSDESSGEPVSNVRDVAHPTPNATPAAQSTHDRNGSEDSGEPHVFAAHEASPIVEAEAAMRYAQSRRLQIARTYETVVDASQFRVVSYDPASETLVVALSEPLELVGGLATISLSDDHTLMFAVNADAADYIETQWRSGGVELRLRYELASRQDMARAYCGRNEMGGPELSGALLEASMIESMRDRQLATMETERAVRERCSLRAEGRGDRSRQDARLVDVHTLESFGPETMSEAEAVMLTVFSELVLGECFFNARINNAALEGAVVVNFELTPDGGMRDARLTIDALRSEVFRTCALEAFSQSRIPRLADASVLDTRMTLIFSSSGR